MIASENQAKLQELLADSKRNPWLTENGARKIMVGDEPVAGRASIQIAAFEEQKVEDPNLALEKLPVLHRPAVASALAAVGASTMTEKTFTPFPDYTDDDDRYTEYDYGKTNDLKVQFDLFPLHLRQESKARIKDYSGVPLDFVFQLEGNTSGYLFEYFPHEIEILIPVRLSSIPPEKDASNRNLPVLFDIAGDREHPDLSTVEPINVGPRWLYDVRVCYAYRIAQLGYWGIPQFEKQKEFWVSNLLIRIRSAAKWPKGTRNWQRPINANFLLKGVKVFVDRNNPDCCKRCSGFDHRSKQHGYILRQTCCFQSDF